VNVIETRYFVSLYPSFVGEYRRSGAPCAAGSGLSFMPYARIVWGCMALAMSQRFE